MEIRLTLNGTEDEANELFRNYNVRQMIPYKSGKYEVVIRVSESFKKPMTTSMKELMQSLKVQGESLRNN